MQNI